MKNIPIKYTELSEIQKTELSMNGKIELIDEFRDDSKTQASYHNAHWSYEYVNQFVKRYSNKSKKEDRSPREFAPPYGERSLIEIRNEITGMNIKNKQVAVIGSHTPWIEAIMIDLGNQVTTIEYNIKSCDHPKLNVLTYDDFLNSDIKFDTIISYSSIEHSGLGRYGDKFEPNADIETMNNLHTSLKTNGRILLAVPVDVSGSDRIIFNLHRVYGKLRLPKLLDKFKITNYDSYDSIFASSGKFAFHQPLIVLQKKDY